MRWIRIGLIFAGALLAAIVIVVVLLFTLDLGRFKPLAEEFASDLLGRRIHIDGIFEPSLGREIRVVAEGVRIDNPDWADGDALLRAKRIDVSLDTRALLSLRYLLNNVELDGIVIALEQSADGANNWTLFETDTDEETVAADEPASPLDLLIRQARIRDLAVTYVDPARDSPLRFKAASIDQVQLDSGDVELTLDGDLNGTPVTLDATAGTFADILAAGEVHYELSGGLGEISISSNARIDSLAEPRKPVGQLAISGPNAEYLTDILGIEPVTRGPLNLVATLETVADQMALQVQGDYGEFEIDVVGSFSDLQEFDDVSIDFNAAGPDAATFGGLTGLDGIPADPYSIRGAVRGEGETAIAGNVAIQIGDTEFDLNATIAEFPVIDGAVLSLRVDGPEFGRFNKLLGLPGKLTGPFSLTADLSQSPDGKELVAIAANAQDIQVTVDGEVSTATDFVGTELALSIKGDNLSVIADALDIPDVPAAPFDVSADVSRVNRGVAIDDGIAKLGNDVITIAGLVGNAPLESDTDITVAATGPDLRKTLAMLPVELGSVPARSYRIDGRVHREDAGFEIEDLIATLGAKQQYRVQVDGLVTDAPEFEGSSAQVSAKGPSVAEIAAIAGVSGLPAAAFSVSGTVDRRAAGFGVDGGEVRVGKDALFIDGLVGNAPLEKDTDLQFRAAGPDLVATLKAGGIEVELLPAGSFETAGRIRRRPDHFALDGITARLGGTRAKLAGRLGNLTDFSGTDIDVEIDGDSLAGVAPEISGFRFEDVPFSVASKVRIAKDQLDLAGLKLRIGQGRLDGDASIGMSPMLGSGSVSVAANGPNISEWVPRFAEFVPADAPFDLTGAVRWHDEHLTVDRLVLELAKGRIAANGEVDIEEFSKTDFDLDAQITSISNLGRIAGMELPDQPLTLSARLDGSPRALTLSDFRLTAGPSDLAGTATYDTSGDQPRVDVDLTSRFLDPTPFLPPDDAETAPAAAAPADDGRLIPDTPIPAEALRELNAHANVSIGELVLPNGAVKDLLLDGSLQDGSLRIERFSLTGDRGTLAGELQVLPDPAGSRITANIDGAEMTLGLTPIAPGALDLLPHYDVQVKLAASGATYRELAGSLDGTVRLVGGSGQVKGFPAWFLRDATAEVFDKVNPFSKQEGFTRIQCVTILLRSVDGQVDGVPAVLLQTDKLNIVGVAYVDLKTEKIDVKIETAARKGLGIGAADFVTPYTKIGGTMASPKLAFDTEEAVARGAQTAATLGTSWIAKKVKSRFFSPKDPCGLEVAKADEEMKASGAN
ncbi:MAG: AsmA family protein [Gammaproteobacteria bacterium]